MRNNRTDCVTILIHNVIYLLLIKNAFDYVIGGLDFTQLFVLQLSIALRARTQRQLARPRPIYRSSFHRRGSARSRRCRSSVRSRSAARRSLAPAPAPRARQSGRSRCPRGCYCHFALFDGQFSCAYLQHQTGHQHSTSALVKSDGGVADLGRY